MGLFSFAKNVGKSLFGGDSDDAKKQEQIQKEIKDLGLDAGKVKVKVDGDKVTIDGDAIDQATKEKIILAAGNVEGIGSVDDKMKAKSGDAGDGKFVTVEKGDTLSAISKRVYGDANKYNVIFEANKPMLKSPDLIYPGQVLRIPAE